VSSGSPITLRQRQRRRQFLFLARVAVLASILAGGFFLGWRAANSRLGVDPDTYRSMGEALPAARSEIKTLSADLEVEHMRHEVDRRALEMVRREIATQKEQIADLEEGLRFYKSLMAPAQNSRGLSLRALELVAREDDGRYAYRLVAQQEAAKHNLLKGKLTATVFGVLAGEEVSYSLSELSEDIEGTILALSFRYFQAIEGEMTLPSGFEPRRVSVVASASKPRKQKVKAEFPWRVQERFTHVGK